MKVGFLINPYAPRPLAEVLGRLRERFPALEAVEVGMSPYGSLAHGDPERLGSSREARAEWEETFLKAGLRLSSISAHGNPLHPREDFARLSRDRFKAAVALMGKLEGCLLTGAGGQPVRVVNAFSGLPGEVVKKGEGLAQTGSVPIWHTAPWPDEHFDAYRLQVKYAGQVWRELVKLARDQGVKVALELHPNMLAHSAESYLELLEEAGDDGTTLGLNFDPSHFFWRFIDPLAMLRHLRSRVPAGAVKHVHGKDCFTDRFNCEVNGCLSMVPYSEEARRPWRFVTIGEGWDPLNGPHDLNWWQRFITELQLGGYDHVVSIEHEDSRKSFEEGVGKALAILDQAVNREPPGPITWARR